MRQPLRRAAYKGDSVEVLADRIAAMNLRDRRKFINERMGAPVLQTVQAVSRALDKNPRTRLLGRVNLRLLANRQGPTWKKPVT